MGWSRYLKAAFLAPANLIGLAAASLASATSGEPTAAGIAAGLEILYLALVPLSPSFRRGVREGARAGAGEVQALVEELAPSQREQYSELCELRDRILANYRKLPGGGVVVASSEQRVDALLTSFLRLLSTLNNYRKYLGATDRAAVEAELGQLEAEVAAEQNPRLKEVKQKRVEILQRRLQRYRLAEESREVVAHQLAGVEDLLRLTYEQSVVIRDPESLGRQLEALSQEVQATDETVREMEKFMEFTEESSLAMPHGTRVR